MSRPTLMRLAPAALRTRIFYRLYRKQVGSYAELYRQASLTFAPQVRMTLRSGDVISDQIAFTGFYELLMSRWVTKIAQSEGGLMVDAGANIGYFSLLWSSAGSGNRVEAFEASPRVFPMLKENIEKNADVADRINLHNNALGAESSEMEFDVGPADQDGWGGLVNQTSEQSVKVQVTRLDQKLADLDVTLLKVDVEGADTWVLQGASQLLEGRRIKYITWEQNLTRMAALGIAEGEALKLVRDYGYDCQPLESSHGTTTQWLATRQ